jgi:hypothetical protein
VTHDACRTAPERRLLPQKQTFVQRVNPGDDRGKLASAAVGCHEFMTSDAKGRALVAPGFVTVAAPAAEA